MTNQRFAIVVIALTLALTGTQALNAQVRVGSASAPVYDNFNSKWLDPSKWTINANCWNRLPMKCVREIQSGQLRLLVRGLGSGSTDSGDQNASSFLAFLNPGSIRSITTTVTVRAADGVACATNPLIGTGKGDGRGQVLQHRKRE